MDKKHYKIRVTGKVQDVGFRSSAKRRAEELGLHGFARNEPDGTVYVEVEGSADQVEKFLEWCQNGSNEAIVETVDVTDHPPVGHEGFERL